ncbi:hypothetical protein FisN_26Hh077 [Fistulifera solaris]|uniref:DUF6824 domain-containing protein n=1 Tax=Fistulifera solaris TaxID=1519565 RepID=A0A1Z5JY88_FISSO|nr:hypothetical protein FisN_26Hh077 [Fistulifera solaris]|eukprot:GAX18778.1 hypothetical protein FisN_26Hh077 [Fistulifera solaris]
MADSLPDRMNAIVLSDDDEMPKRKRRKTSSDDKKHAYYRQLVAQVLVRYQEERSNDAQIPEHNDQQITCPNRRSVGASPKMKQDDDDPSQSKDSIMILKINDHDVLFGRRSAQRNHPGNLKLREMCCNLQADYRDSHRSQKTAMTWRIVHTIQARGGRFLKEEEEDVWREVSPEVAREKVAFTIRDLNVSECH